MRLHDSSAQERNIDTTGVEKRSIRQSTEWQNGGSEDEEQQAFRTMWLVSMFDTTVRFCIETFTPRTDDLYDLYDLYGLLLRHDLYLSGQIDSRSV